MASHSKNMKEEKDSKHRNFMKTYNSIRKPAIPPDKTIVPEKDHEKGQRWNWRQEWLEDEDNDYTGMNQEKEQENKDE